jgi:hypothetical protein
LSLKTKIGGLSVIWPQNHWDSFSWFSLKIGSSGLMIWALKSPRRFLGLDLKTKQASVYRLRHKTDEGRMTRDTHRDLTACFTWKQVTLGFPSLASRLAETQWRVVHMPPSRRLRRVQIEDRCVDAMGCSGPFYPRITIFMY